MGELPEGCAAKGDPTGWAAIRGLAWLRGGVSA